MADKVSLATLALAKAYTDEHGGGGGGTSNYNDLTHKPTVNSVEFKGTMTGADLGLVNAETGKSLSTNDYTDADKAIVDGVTSALADKVDKVSGKGLSTNDYDDTAKGIVDGVTSALGNKADASTVNAILDGQSLDSFGDVESALADKVSKSSTVGLLKNDGTVDTTTYIASTEKGENSGVASLDSNGKVPTTQVGLSFNANVPTNATLVSLYYDSTHYEVPSASVGRHLADLFSSTKAYTVGDYCWYAPSPDYVLKIYKCTTAHTGAWDDTHFTEIKLADEVSDKAKVKLLTNTDDLNNLEETSSYYVATSVPANMPENRTNSAIQNFYYSENDIKQVVFARTGDMYLRSKANTWSSWYKLTGTALTS